MIEVTTTDWLPAHFDEVFSQISTTGKKVKTAEALTEGRFPVVDQGRIFISGYLDDASLVVSDEKPLIIFGDHTREIKWIDFDFIPGADGVKILKPHPNMNGRFLYFFLRNIQIGDKGYARHFKILKDAEYRIPPLAEQTRIAQKLDELLAQVDTLKARIDAIPALLKRFRQSVLASAVSGRLTTEWRAKNSSLASTCPPESATTVDSTWPEVSLSDVARSFSYGSSAKSKPNGDVPVLRMGNIQGGCIDWTDLVFSTDEAEIKKYALHAGDILFNRTNSPELVGKTAIYKGDRPAIYAGYLIRVRCSEFLKPEFLNYCLNSPQGRHYCWQVKTDGVSQSNINAKKLAAFRFGLPEFEEQTEIVRRVEQLFAFADQLEAKVASAKTRIDHLTQSILAKAFRGELVPQDPNDEPASVLLERIKAQRAAAPKAKHGRKASV